MADQAYPAARPFRVAVSVRASGNPLLVPRIRGVRAGMQSGGGRNRAKRQLGLNWADPGVVPIFATEMPELLESCLRPLPGVPRVSDEGMAHLAAAEGGL